jgi:hypothetical protein
MRTFLTRLIAPRLLRRCTEVEAYVRYKARFGDFAARELIRAWPEIDMDETDIDQEPLWNVTKGNRY